MAVLFFLGVPTLRFGMWTGRIWFSFPGAIAMAVGGFGSVVWLGLEHAGSALHGEQQNGKDYESVFLH
jgi:hypothetical protein